MKRTCKQCGKEFFLSKSEIDFYKSKNLSFPRRCRECRAANKSGGDGEQADTKQNNTDNGKQDKTNVASATKPANNRKNADKPNNNQKNSGKNLNNNQNITSGNQNNKRIQNSKNKQNVQDDKRDQRVQNGKNAKNDGHHSGVGNNRPQSEYTSTDGKNVQKKSKAPIYLLVLALILSLGVLIGLWVARNSNSQSGDVTTSAITTEVNTEVGEVTVDTPTVKVEEPTVVVDDPTVTTKYTFASRKLLDEHYEKHGIEMGFASAQEYEQAASDVVNNPNALTKKEAEDNDDVYYIEATNEFVVVSTSGSVRTYFKPNKGKAYFDEQ